MKDVREQKAATKIQTIQRGKEVRQHVAKGDLKEWREETGAKEAAQEAAATKIQVGRMHVCSCVWPSRLTAHTVYHHRLFIATDAWMKSVDVTPPHAHPHHSPSPSGNQQHDACVLRVRRARSRRPPVWMACVRTKQQ